MIQLRKKGLFSLYTLSLMIVLPAWFLLMGASNQFIIGKSILFDQIDFPIYIMGIEISLLLSLAYNKLNVPAGSKRSIWRVAVKQANQTGLWIFIIFLSIIWATKDKTISRQFVALYFLSVWFLLLFMYRYTLRLMSRIIFKGSNQLNTILLGSPKTADRLKLWSNRQAAIGIKVIGLVSSGSRYDIERCSIPYLGQTTDLEEIIEEKNIHQIVLLETRASKSWVRYVGDVCKKHGARLLIFNHWEEYFDQPMVAVNEGELNFFAIGIEPLQNPVNRLVKRGLDVCVALPIVCIILPILAVIIKIMQIFQSPGPLFFKQTRTGFGKNNFVMLKFRSMHYNKDGDSGKQASQGDERIFKFGSFLRRSSLDEFPQFINVLKGTMSVVGPRPHMVEHDKEFAKLIEFYKSRHFVKPGITGLAQERGFRGEIIKSAHIEGRIELDLHYIKNWSIWLDIALIIRTFSQIFFPPKGAY